MNRDEFVKRYYEVAERALILAQKARRVGLLELEDDIDLEKVEERDIFEYGLRFIVDGTDKDIVNGILSNIITHEKDEYLILLKNIQKEAILLIQYGMTPTIIHAMLNSYTDLSIKDDETKKVLDKITEEWIKWREENRKKIEEKKHDES